MRFNSGRKENESLIKTQSNNKNWWSNNPMTYEWKSKNKYPKYSLEWFNNMDKRELYGHRLFDSEIHLESNIIPIELIKGIQAEYSETVPPKLHPVIPTLFISIFGCVDNVSSAR